MEREKELQRNTDDPVRKVFHKVSRFTYIFLENLVRMLPHDNAWFEINKPLVPGDNLNKPA